jgi:predicted AAA+ superfamily ATPase
MKNLNIRLRSLAVFRSLLNDPVICALLSYLDAPEDKAEAVSRYGEFVSRLYATESPTLAAYIRSVVSDDENACIRIIGRGEEPSEALRCCVQQELAVLQAVSELTPEALRADLDWDGYLPEFPAEKIDLAAHYADRCARIGSLGYGIYARYRMFYIDPEDKIVPVRNPDRTRLADLVDYEREKKIILDNTLALLEGKPAANILLTGDAGTGKSSTVKAVVNELHGQGLRILEVRKEQLHQIPGVLDELNSNPLKFILFIDDLSFQKDDDNFSALKAILEGSVAARSRNVVIYATSNRRHLVKESFSDRDGDDVHRNDTMQEIISLSERFGIQITFQKPNKQTYLGIVRHLAEEAGIELPEGELEARAERFVLGRGGRSARAARQFVDGLIAERS